MNTLFIIGNGFDINLGLKTGYKDFYNYYQNIKSKTTSVDNLKKNISDNFENWADLEIALGEYTEKISSLEEFDEIYEDLVNELATYLEEQENKLDFSSIKRDQFYLDLQTPQKFLLLSDEHEIDTFRTPWDSSTWVINLMTFNYTKTIEKILADDSPSIKIGNHHGRYEVYLQEFEHIHGFVDDRMILGVNDISQIKNAALNVNEDLCNALIKSNYNKVIKKTVHRRCEQLIENANLICIFGSSIGDTDKLWWELIGTQLKKNCRLIIFRRYTNLSNRFSHKVSRVEREMKNYFLNKTSLTEEEKSEVLNKIYIAINTSIFSNLLPRL
ncbi:hypothetical protein GCM10028818_20860 [Spirosoma horti]